VPIFFVVSEIQGSKLQKLSKSIKFRILGPPCINPLADLKNFASKRAPAYPLSIGLHLMTLRQKQKVAVLFTKMSTLTPKNIQPPTAGTPSTEQPQKRRILLGAQDVYTLRIWCRSPHAFPRYGLRNISPLTSM